MNKQWSIEKAWNWYNGQDWIVGCNYIPSDCISYLEIWQEYEFVKKLETIKKELMVAADMGMNSVRMFFSFRVWKYQREGFVERISKVLDVLDSYGMKMMAVFFDDCCGPVEHYHECKFGEQPKPTKGYHGGFAPSANLGLSNVGYSVLDVIEEEQNVFRFVTDIVTKFKDDKRIMIWDILNEPGNSNRGSKSLEKMEKVFELIRSLNPIQPLTAGAWSFPDGKMFVDSDIKDIEKRAMELSDIISYHYYGDYETSVAVIERLKQYNRPMLITEWLHRPFSNNVNTHLPLFKKEKIGCYNWGLVAGKTQTYEPWEVIRKISGLDLSKWQHDLFHEDLTPYNVDEIITFNKYTATDPVAEYTSVITTQSEVAYGRIICLEHNEEKNGTLLVTYEQIATKDNKYVYPIYCSKDEGKTWEHISDLPCLEGQESWHKWQPQLYELPCKVGDMEEGTILLAGNSFSKKNTNIYLYKSIDVGHNWEYISTIVTANSFEDGVWEPNLIATDDGTLICYFADETENQKHSQKLSLRLSKDGFVWSESKDVVAMKEKELRPGMPSTIRYYDGSYIVAYEMVGEEGNPNYVSYSKDGFDWGDVDEKGNRAITFEGTGELRRGYSIGCSPVMVWSPIGKDEKGSLIMSGMIMSKGQAMEGNTDYFISFNGGEEWRRFRHPIPYYQEHSKVREAYSNGMTLSNDRRTIYSVNTIYEDRVWKVVFAAVSLDKIIDTL